MPPRSPALFPNPLLPASILHSTTPDSTSTVYRYIWLRFLRSSPVRPSKSSPGSMNFGPAFRPPLGPLPPPIGPSWTSVSPTCALIRQKHGPPRPPGPASAGSADYEQGPAHLGRYRRVDGPSLLACHLPRSRPKAEAIPAEYDRLIVLLETNPLAFRSRPHGGRVGIFRSGTDVPSYRELDEYWLVAGISSARRDPDWIQTQRLIREVRAQP